MKWPWSMNSAWEGGDTIQKYTVKWGCNTIKYNKNTVGDCNTIQYAYGVGATIQYNTIHIRCGIYNTIQYNTHTVWDLQYNTIQYTYGVGATIQYNTIHIRCGGRVVIKYNTNTVGGGGGELYYNTIQIRWEWVTM